MATFEVSGNSLFLTTRSQGRDLRVQLVANDPYSMNFNFRGADQNQVLTQLQAQGYSLLGYKGATGPSQVTAGLPTWFSVPFTQMFGAVAIDYTPQYQVYICRQATIAANTVITMDVSSNPVGLGTALNFLQNGQIVSATNGTPGTITINDQRSANSIAVTVGLAGLVTLPSGASEYLPFCAFTLNPQGSIAMAPNEEVALMAAQLNLVSGTVNANAAAPGCSFPFDSASTTYNLMIEPGSFQITNVPGSLPVTPMSGGTSLSFLNIPS